jgi:2-methylcitrate dehydratase PrpD
MRTAAISIANKSNDVVLQPLATRIAQAALALTADELSAQVIEKVKICLFDLIGCAFESRDLPWSMQAKQLLQPVSEGHATVIGSSQTTSYADAAFANAVMGHGLVREDMHSGSVSHLGIVVLPTLLALSQYRRVTGREFIAAAVVGYEVGGRIGRAAMTPEIARIHRPTGISGPPGAAAAGARLVGLDAAAATSAIALATNTTLGFNQWAHTGGSEMFFQAGFAARNALTAVRLAQAGAFASPSALDGEAGLFASLGKRDAAANVTLFDSEAEILSVYHKPVPACNFAQTACQAALAIGRDRNWKPDQIESVRVRIPRAGMLYPGCNSTGPFEHVLQAKMSIQYNVAAALIKGSVSEDNFALLDDPQLHRLIGAITMEIDDDMTRAYPGKQGGEVEVVQRGGERQRIRLEDVVFASAADVRDRFLKETASALGEQCADEIEKCIDGIEHSDDAGRLAALLGSSADNNGDRH